LKLLVKFNLVFFTLFLAGIGACGFVSWNLLQRNARLEIAESARLLMENAIAVRTYTNKQIKPLLDTQIKYSFPPQTVPAYAATEVLNQLRARYPEFAYKEAMLNPTNPRDKAVDWETDVIERFRSAGGTEVFGERETAAGRVLYFARPLVITDGACLLCHSSVDAAPQTMIDKYGTANGFGWNLNDTVGAQVVSVPTEVPLARARAAFTTFMASLAGVLLVIGLLLNLAIWWMFIRPVMKLSNLADRVSLGELEASDIRIGGRDEIHTLAESIARMRKSMSEAMKMLES